MVCRLHRSTEVAADGNELEIAHSRRVPPMMFGTLLIAVVFAFPRGIAGGLATAVESLKRQP
jgi:hypothetical protein